MKQEVFAIWGLTPEGKTLKSYAESKSEIGLKEESYESIPATLSVGLFIGPNTNFSGIFEPWTPLDQAIENPPYEIPTDEDHKD